MKKTGGFTLLEMLFTLCIFVLLCGAVFGLITTVLTTTASLQTNQNRADQISALNAFLTKHLSSLPAGAVLVSYRRGDGDGLNNTGIIVGAGKNLLAIDAKLQANSYYTLRVVRFGSSDKDIQILSSQVNPLVAFQNEVQSSSESLNWTPLIHDVVHVDWKFQAANTTKWDDQWFLTQQKPNLVEISIQISGDLQPSVMDFWVPNLTSLPIFIATPSTP
ncbi:MAG: hypothetical protein LV479_08570 [Methylacidiphilales bacterium]|nr:hypothetical protein [Candidatus Methylacidiphilales bacterium]